MGDTVRLRGDRRNNASREAVLQRVYGEFKEMPCLRLTEAQARRLFGLTPDICNRVFAQLTCERLLARSADGRYRLSEGDSARARSS
jgi:hypothetical protein